MQRVSRVAGSTVNDFAACQTTRLTLADQLCSDIQNRYLSTSGLRCKPQTTRRCQEETVGNDMKTRIVAEEEKK